MSAEAIDDEVAAADDAPEFAAPVEAESAPADDELALEVEAPVEGKAADDSATLETDAPEAESAPANDELALEIDAPEAEAAPAMDDDAEPAAESQSTSAPALPLEPERRTVGHAIARQLAAAGTRLAFTVPGESFLEILDGFRAAGVRVVTTRHEGAAAFMASAASQLSGKPQVVMATRAVGAANASIGIHAARADSAPLIAIFGQVRRGFRGREAFQEVELVTAPGSYALWAAEARDETDALRIVTEGLRHQVAGRPGPIVLSIPEDVQQAESAPGWEPAQPPTASGQSAEREQVRRTLKMLAAAQRPVILAGGGVLRARASKRLTLLAEALEVPVVAAWRRPDVIPGDHPLYLGMSGYFGAATVLPRLLEADVILALGTRLNEITTFGYRLPAASSQLIHVDLEPRTGAAGLDAPALAVTADVARFLDACWSDLRGAAIDNEMRSRRQERNAADRQKYLDARRVDNVPGAGSGVHPGRVVAALQAALPPDALVTTDAGNFGGWIARGFRFGRPGTFLGTASGAMGYGFPAAIAGALLRPDRPSVAVCGDGGFAMTMAELETAVRERARVMALVFDNGGYGTIRMHQARAGLPETGTPLGPIDFAGVATAAGALGITVERDDEVEPALREALAARRPAVIHLKVDPRWVSVDEGPAA